METHLIEEDCERLPSDLRGLLRKAEADDRAFTAGEDQRCENLENGIRIREAVIAEKTAKTLEARQAIIDRFALAPEQDSTNGGVILNTGRPSPNQNRSRSDGPDADRGRSAIDDAFRSGDLPDYAASKATALVERGHEGERSLAGR
jgi:hypothetical protein